MNKFKRGDIVRVIEVEPIDIRCGVKLNAVYEVGDIDPDGDVYPLGTFRGVLHSVTHVVTPDKFKDYNGTTHLNTTVILASQLELVKD